MENDFIVRTETSTICYAQKNTSALSVYVIMLTSLVLSSLAAFINRVELESSFARKKDDDEQDYRYKNNTRVDDSENSSDTGEDEENHEEEKTKKKKKKKKKKPAASRSTSNTSLEVQTSTSSAINTTKHSSLTPLSLSLSTLHLLLSTYIHFTLLHDDHATRSRDKSSGSYTTVKIRLQLGHLAISSPSCSSSSVIRKISPHGHAYVYAQRFVPFHVLEIHLVVGRRRRRSVVRCRGHLDDNVGKKKGVVKLVAVVVVVPRRRAFVLCVVGGLPPPPPPPPFMRVYTERRHKTHNKTCVFLCLPIVVQK